MMPRQEHVSCIEVNIRIRAQSSQNSNVPSCCKLTCPKWLCHWALLPIWPGPHNLAAISVFSCAFLPKSSDRDAYVLHVVDDAIRALSSLILRVIIECIVMIGILQVLISFITVPSRLLASPISLFCCKWVLSLYFVLFHIDYLCIDDTET